VPEVHSQKKTMIDNAKIIEAAKYILKTSGTDENAA
jgi:hypothetical protein